MLILVISTRTFSLLDKLNGTVLVKLSDTFSLSDKSGWLYLVISFKYKKDASPLRGMRPVENVSNRRKNGRMDGAERQRRMRRHVAVGQARMPAKGVGGRISRL